MGDGVSEWSKSAQVQGETLAPDDLASQLEAQDCDGKDSGSEGIPLGKELLDMLPAAVYICDRQGIIRYYNHHAATLWGQEPQCGDTHQRFCGAYRLYYLDGSPMPHASTPMNDALREGKAQRNREVIFERPNGSRITVLVNIAPLRDQEGNVIGAVNVLQDISERTQAQQARAYLAAVVESTEDAIVSSTLEGIITSWNGGAERLYGYSADEITGQPVTLLLPPDGQNESSRIRERLRKGHSVKHHETTRLRKDGSRVEVSVTISPVRDEGGKIIGVSAITRDISERKQAERTLREANRRKDEFLAMLGHELRNPLVPIRSGIDLLALEAGDHRETIAVMQQQVQHLVRLVDGLLDVSRIVRGKVELQREQVELSAFLRHAIESVRPDIDRQGQTLVVSLPAQAVWLDADPIRLVQVVENVLGNASKYTHRGGRIELTAVQQGQEARIIVHDNGIGIDGELLPHIFDLFSQANRSLDRSQGGLGIGLTLVQSLVQMHGGTVEAHSEGLGKGSEFIIRLPITARLHEEPVHESVPIQSIPRRVLIVEDNEGSAKILARLLAKIGSHEVRIAHNGFTALEVVRSFRPELVLMDIGLPQMDGYELARRIRQEPEAEEILLVALTGYGQEEDRRRSKEAGFDAHLLKPPSLDILQTLFNHPKLSPTTLAVSAHDAENRGRFVKIISNCSLPTGFATW